MDEKLLRDLREKIDAVDQGLVRLISDRARFAQQVAAIKAEDRGKARFYRPDREAHVLKRVIEHNRGPLPDPEMARLIREVMSACLALEQRLQVAFMDNDRDTFCRAKYRSFSSSLHE